MPRVVIMMSNKNEIIKKRYNRISTIFDQMDRMIKVEWRKKVLSHVYGNVLEVGIGTGANLPYYPRDVSLTGIDFSDGMLRHARKKAKELNRSVTLLEMDAQHMSFPDNTFDFVVATCVFCSVPNPILGLQEIRRVCKPEGKILMLEHMRSENPFIGAVMDILNPVTVRLSGANINRRTLENVHHAGLCLEESESLIGSIMKRLVISPNKDLEFREKEVLIKQI
jgi:ubiquinone/menaquinone biosynthesis C-methylase UbiE